MALKYRKLTLQIGCGEFIPDVTADVPNLELEWYRYKESLASDMKEAQLIISHGGGCDLMSSGPGLGHFVFASIHY